MKNTLAGFLVASLLLAPGVSLASSEQETIEKLQAYIQLLVSEVQKIQEKISSFKHNTYADPLPAQEIREIIADSVTWFKNAQSQDGRHNYEYEPYSGTYLNDDNIVRQAGALYALGEVIVNDTENVHDLKEHMIANVMFFENQSPSGTVNGRSFRCVANSTINNTCQLGATGLALVGLIDLVTAHPELKDEYDSLIHDYGAYIIAMKKEGAGFRNIFTDGAALTDRESSFSNGESLLALARYYRFEPSEETKRVIDDTFDYFESDEVPFDFPLYLWVMAALKDMHEVWPNDRYVEYVKDYTNWRLGGFLHRKASTHNMCAYAEGVLSAYSVLEESSNEFEKKRIQNEINFWLDRVSVLQIDASDQYRVIVDEETLEARFGEIANMNLAFGGFLTGQTKLTQRIDFTQHCLNSYVQQLVDIDGERF